MRFLVFLAAALACASAQGPGLNSFNQVRNALLEGSELVLNGFANECQTTGLENNNLVVSMPMRHWEVVTYPTGFQEIRADDFFIETGDAQLATWIMRAAHIFEDETVEITLTIVGSNETQITMNCELGQGAEAHRAVQGNDLVDVDLYSELKTYLLLGDHVEAVGRLSDCEGGDALGATEYIAGFQIVRFNVIGDGTPEELIVFDDVAVASADGTNYVMGTEQVVISRDGTAAVNIAVFDLNVQPITEIALTCQIGSTFTFTIHRREDENSYATYNAIKQATLEGHDMEIVVFVGNCDVLEGDAINVPGTIVSARADEFNLMRAGDVWGPLEFIVYSSWGLDAEGNLYSEIARLYEDGSLTIEYFSVAPFSDVEMNKGLLSCPLQQATVFHAVRRDRNPIDNYNRILEQIETQGQIFEIEIDYDLCNTGGIVMNRVFGGIAWETYIDPDRQNGFIYATEFNIVETQLTGAPAPAWLATGVALTPDGTAYIAVRVYDLATGANLSPIDNAVVCELGQGIRFIPYELI